MKMSSALIERTLSQFDAQPIPDNHPAVGQLNNLFGDHTFFLDGDGLSIVEPAGPAVDGHQEGKVVKLAGWNDESRSSLALHEPKLTDTVVELGPKAAGGKG
jgi:hypothetical protein